MGDVTTLLFGLKGLRVVTVMVEQEQNERDALEPGKGVREVVVKGLEGEQACPDCGVLSDTCTLARSGGSRICRMAAGCCGCGGTGAAGRAGRSRVGGGRSLRPAFRSAPRIG